MFSYFLSGPSFMPCPQCGAAVARTERDQHECDEERRLDYRVFLLRAEVDSFDQQLVTYLGTARGRFETWDAEQRRPPL